MCSIDPKEDTGCPDYSAGCKLLECDDSKCTDICKCCVGISDYGENRRCRNACRACRQLGSVWDPRRPMKPLDYTPVYNQLPGYATTGDFVEHFNVHSATGIPGLDQLICVLFGTVASYAVVKVLLVVTKQSFPDRQLWMIAFAVSVWKCLIA